MVSGDGVQRATTKEIFRLLFDNSDKVVDSMLFVYDQQGSHLQAAANGRPPFCEIDYDKFEDAYAAWTAEEQPKNARELIAIMLQDLIDEVAVQADKERMVEADGHSRSDSDEMAAITNVEVEADGDFSSDDAESNFILNAFRSYSQQDAAEYASSPPLTTTRNSKQELHLG
jgi:hypothetical protein